MEKRTRRIDNAKLRRRVYVDKESPFPVPVSSISTEPSHSTKWSFYTGQLIDNYVAVSHTGDLEFLYRKGFFGKGNLSRNQPVYEQGGANHFYGKKKKMEQMLRITSRRKYLRHLAWKTGESVDLLPLRNKSKNKDLEDKKEIQVIKPASTIKEADDTNTSQQMIRNDTNTTDSDNLPSCSSSELMDVNNRKPELNTSEKPQLTSTEEETDSCVAPAQDSWGVSDAADDPWASCTQTETDSFWGESSQGGECNREETNSFWGDTNTINKSVTAGNLLIAKEISTNSTVLEEGNINQKTENAISEYSSNLFSKDNDNKEDNYKSTLKDNKCSSTHSTAIIDESCVEICDTSSEKTESTSSQDIVKHSQCGNNSVDINSKSSEACTSENIENLGTKNIEIENSDIKTAERLKSVNTSSKNDATKKRNHETGTKNEKSKHVPTDPLCLSDHEDGDLFVVNDTDESDLESDAEYANDDEDCNNINRVKRYKWEPAVKNDPFRPKELLRLSLEEAFFLSYGLGCLVVLDEQKKPLDLTEMWTTFCNRQKNFISNYIVYHYYRSQGWVPKTGLKFGGDFLIYKDGPPFYHASYVVMVRYVDEDTFDDINDHCRGKLSWQMIAGQNRVTEQVSKELMLCFVIKPANMTDAELKSPSCISQLKLQEVIVKRWVTKLERDNLKFMDIP